MTQAAAHPPAGGAHPEKKTWMSWLGDILIGVVALVIFFIILRALFPTLSDNISGFLHDLGLALANWGKELIFVSLGFGVLNQGVLMMVIRVLMVFAFVLFAAVMGILIRHAYEEFKAAHAGGAHGAADHPAPAAPQPAAGGGGGGNRRGGGGGGGQPAAAGGQAGH
jgi:hypothetical protein